MSNRELYRQYLLSKGIPLVKVQGILLNIEDESGFSPNPSGSNDQGMAYGLFQHYGPRRDALFQFAGSRSPTWQQQLDYALSEPDMADYLRGNYADVGTAATAFMDKFERPAKRHRDARAAKYRREYGHWQPGASQTVSMSQVSGGPAYPGGQVVPVSGESTPPPLATPGAGNPMTESLPPPLQSSITDEYKQSLGHRLAANPFLQMGLGILSNPNNWAQGAQSGLLAASQMGEGLIGKRLYEQQLELARRKQMGQVALSPAEHLRNLVAQRGLDLREAELEEKVATRRLAGQEGAGAQFNPGQAYNEFVAVMRRPPADEEEYLAWIKRRGTVGGKGASGDKAFQYGTQLDQLSALMTELEQNPGARKGLGTLGEWGAPIAAGLGILDKLTGSNMKSGAIKFFGGVDPRVLKGKLQGVVLPVARLMVDEKGPLSTTEQRAARQLIGILESGDGLLDPDQAWELLQLTHTALKRQEGAATRQTTPPQTGGAPPSEVSGSPGVGPYSDPDKEARYKAYEAEQLRKAQQGTIP